MGRTSWLPYSNRATGMGRRLRAGREAMGHVHGKCMWSYGPVLSDWNRLCDLAGARVAHVNSKAIYLR